MQRDIKPDNILSRDGSLTQTILIDFGLSVCETDDNELEYVQIESRFLYLGQLKYSGGNKRDKRSDIAFVGMGRNVRPSSQFYTFI